jgi:YidC/Oxa1 family membrane protein insertase
MGILYHWINAIPGTANIGSYGLAIIALVLLAKIVLLPVFHAQLKIGQKTQREMAKIAPQITELRKTYKGNELTGKIKEVYLEHGVAPLSPFLGCLPAIIQVPVFVGLYFASNDHQFFQTLHANANFLTIDLTHPAHLTNLHTWPLPFIVVATLFVQTRLFAAPSSEKDPKKPVVRDAVADIQKMAPYLMPLFILYICFLPITTQAVVLYYLVNNLFSIVQQYLLKFSIDKRIKSNSTIQSNEEAIEKQNSNFSKGNLDNESHRS